jgi:putative ABC transport system ATP-binding protein
MTEAKDPAKRYSDMLAAYSPDLTKTFGSGLAAVRALSNVNVAFDRGRFTAVMGPSCSGDA